MLQRASIDIVTVELIVNICRAPNRVEHVFILRIEQVQADLVISESGLVPTLLQLLLVVRIFFLRVLG